MELINNPVFWEVLGAILVLIFAAPFVYLIYVAVRVGYDAWRNEGFRNGPQARMVVPMFGELQLFGDRGWEGMVRFSATQQDIQVAIDATESGPTVEQSAYFELIAQRCHDLLPEIHESLSECVAEDWEFELCGVEITADPQVHGWTGQYIAKTDDDGDMGYFVGVVDWKVAGVTGAD